MTAARNAFPTSAYAIWTTAGTTTTLIAIERMRTAVAGIAFRPPPFFCPANGRRLGAARGEKFGKHARRVRWLFVPDDRRGRACGDDAAAAVAAFRPQI